MQKTALATSIPASLASLELVRPDAAERVSAPDAALDVSTGITTEIMTVIETAVAAFAGKNARILSVKLVGEFSAESNAWVNQGLALVHGSHNTVQRGH